MTGSHWTPSPVESSGCFVCGYNLESGKGTLLNIQNIFISLNKLNLHDYQDKWFCSSIVQSPQEQYGSESNSGCQSYFSLFMKQNLISHLLPMEKCITALWCNILVITLQFSFWKWFLLYIYMLLIFFIFYPLLSFSI